MVAGPRPERERRPNPELWTRAPVSTIQRLDRNPAARTAALAAATLTPAFGQRVQTDFDHKNDFSQYKTSTILRRGSAVMGSRAPDISSRNFCSSSAPCRSDCDAVVAITIE